MSREGLLATVAAYYSARLREHGPTARGADWNSEASQVLRFGRLLELVRGRSDFSLLDYGCGYGALVDHLAAQGLECRRYTGYDVAPNMVEAARRRHEGRSGVAFTSEPDLDPHDFVVASGIFNVKLEAPEQEWQDHLWQTLTRLHGLGRRGFAFNALSLYSDQDKRRKDLYYADPLALFDRCKRHFSPRVALLHDYPLYEFTLIVRQEEA